VPCIGGGRHPASLFLDGDFRRRRWLSPASGESAPWVVMAVVKLLRSAGVAVALCWVSVPSDYFVRTKCWGRFSSHVDAPDTSLAVVCGDWQPRPAWRSSLADLSRGLSAAEVTGGRGGVGGGWRLLWMTSVLRRPLVWIWALSVDVGVPVVLGKVSPLPYRWSLVG
jgi:hypothetical protein